MITLDDLDVDDLWGVQEAQFVHLPPDVASNEAAVEAIEFADSYGLVLDESQQFTLHAGCGERADGTWAASTVADAETRQNGKGDTKIARAMPGLFLWDEPLLIWTSHEFKTANESFLRVVQFIEGSDELRARVKHIRYANGEQGVELRNGGRLKFAARTGGSGRGFAGCSTLFYDEAQHLSAEAVAASSATGAVQKRKFGAHGRQVWFAGSPGFATSKQWWELRLRALRGNGGRMLLTDRRGRHLPGKGGRLALVEHTAERIWLDEKGKLQSEAPDPEDRRTWALANSAYRYRIEHEFLEDQLALLGPELFAREHLGAWDPLPSEELDHEPKIPADKWAETLRVKFNTGLITPGDLTFAVDVEKGSTAGCITLGAGSLLGGSYVEQVPPFVKAGIGWIPARLLELHNRWRPKKIGIDVGGPAGAIWPSIVALFTAAKIDVDELFHTFTLGELKQASGGFLADVEEGRLARASRRSSTGELVGQPELDAAVADVAGRVLGDSWIPDRRTATVPVTPLTTAIMARHLLPAKPVREQRKARVHSF